MQAFELLEKELGEWHSSNEPPNAVHGNDNIIAVSSGTSALHIALESFRFPPGSKVIVPEFTMVACARAVVMAGLTPVFVDCGDDLLIDVNKLGNWNTKWDAVAVMPCHIYGRTCDMRTIRYLASTWGWKVIVDASEQPVVESGVDDAICWSFYRNKIIHGEEGGAIAFKYKEHADYACMLRSQGFTDKHDFLHIPRGVNARLSNSNAELIRKSLKSVEANLAKRLKVIEWYDSQIPQPWRMMARRDAAWVYDVRIPGVDLAQVVRSLMELGIAARQAFKPMSEQEEFRKPTADYESLTAYRMSREVMYLPVYPELDFPEIQRIVAALIHTVAKWQK